MASDHAGYDLKQEVRAWLESQGAQVKDYGCYSKQSCDYPDYAHPLAEAIEKGEHERGIVICSSMRLKVSIGITPFARSPVTSLPLIPTGHCGQRSWQKLAGSTLTKVGMCRTTCLPVMLNA